MLEEKVVNGSLKVSAKKFKLKRGLKYGCLTLLVTGLLAYSQFKKEMAWFIQDNPEIVKFTPPLIDKVYGLLFDRKDLKIRTTTSPVEYILTAKADGIYESIADKAYQADYSTGDLRDLLDAGYEDYNIASLINFNNQLDSLVPIDYALELAEEFKEINAKSKPMTYLGRLANFGFHESKSVEETIELYKILKDAGFDDSNIDRMTYSRILADCEPIDLDYAVDASEILDTSDPNVANVICRARDIGRTIEDLKKLTDAGFTLEDIKYLSGITIFPINKLPIVPIEYVLNKRGMSGHAIALDYQRELNRNE